MAFGNAPHPGVAPQGYEEWAKQSGRARNLQEVRSKFMKPVNSFVNANGDLQWGAMGPTMGMNGSAHISHAVSNLYHSYNHGIGGNIGHTGSMMSSSEHFAMLVCFRDFKKSLCRDEESVRVFWDHELN